jgi:hypothetical protein
MKAGKRSSWEPIGNDAPELWGTVIGIDDRTEQERTFSVYARNGSFLVVDDKGNERLAGPDNGSNKYNILREVMVQFQVHGLRLKPSADSKPPPT